MISNEQVNQFNQFYSNAEAILIVYPKNPTPDILATAVGLYELMVYAQKRVSLASPELPKQAAQFSDVDKTVTEIGNQNLVVSFDYAEESIDKVSYHIGEDTKKFYLTIKPRAGFPPLDAENVDFSYTGVDADLLILVGIKSLQDLEHIYYGYEELYERAPLINIQSNSGRNGIIDINTESGESVSECVTQFIFQAEIPVPDDAATNLLRGIELSTQHLTSLTATADTFEVVSRLMRVGARRSKPAHTVAQSPAPQQTNQVSVTNQGKREGKQTEVPISPKDIKQKQSQKNNTGSLKYTPSPNAPRGG